MPQRKQRRRGPPGQRNRPRRAMPGPSRDLMGIRDTYRFQRTWVAAQSQIVAGSPFLSSISLIQTAIPAGLTTFLGEFDLFRFRSIRIRWVPHWNVNGTNIAGADDELPLIARVVNYDDGNNPASFDAVCGQGGAIVERFNRPVSLTVRPHALGQQIVTTGSMPSVVLYPGDAWFNTAALTTYACYWPLAKFAIQSTSGVAASGRFDIVLDLDLELAQHLSG